MTLPTDETLDEMANKIGGMPFASLGPEARIEIMSLAIQAETSDATHDIANAQDKFAEAMMLIAQGCKDYFERRQLQ